ncbi:enoyl-CoA hydratase-related protein, partial [Chloroflexota bacterium]
MAFEAIIYEKIDHIAKITMNRPEVRNAENRQMSKEIAEAFSLAEEDSEVRVIILAGAGPSFSAGHDMGSQAAIAERENSPPLQVGSFEHYLLEESRWIKPWSHIRDMDKPTIAQVQGYCIMGGLMLATMCDLIIAADDA